MSSFILGKMFANADDHEQGDLLNTMARELYVSCKKQGGWDYQLCYLSKHLNADGEKMIEELAAYIRIRKEEI
jgi:hypothetical protein